MGIQVKFPKVPVGKSSTNHGANGDGGKAKYSYPTRGLPLKP